MGLAIIAAGIVGGIIVIGVVASSIKTITPRYRALIERWGKYNRLMNPGINFIIPFVEKIRYINTTEQMVDVSSPEMITKDALNLSVAAQVYFKVNTDEQSLKNSQYAVNNFNEQIVNLATTTLRKIIGTKTFVEANTERMAINAELMTELEDQVKQWGVQLTRTELKELTPPKEVQEAMNNVLIAHQNMDAAVNNANAAETNADGTRRAAIKAADGKKQAAILEADGEAQAIVLVANAKAKQIEVESKAMQKFFKKEAQTYKKIDMAISSLKEGSKYIVPAGTDLVTVISEAAGIVPISKGKDKK